MSVLIGTDAQFHCGYFINWNVDGLHSDDPNIRSQGITSVDGSSPSAGTVQSNLTVPATSVNNGTTVQCRLFLHLVQLSVTTPP